MTDPARPLRHRPFRLLWYGYGLSGLGDQLTMFALPLLVLHLTGSATQAGLVGTVRLVAFTVAQLPAGALADRCPRRLVMIAADAGRAAAMLLVTAAAVGALGAPLAVLIVAALLEGPLSAAANAAALAATPHVVPRAERSAAVALIQAQTYAVLLAGPLLGSAVFAWQPALAFLLDAVSFLVSLALLASVRTPLGGGTAATRTSLAATVAEGVRYLAGATGLLLLMLWAALVNFATAGLSFALVVTLGPGGAHRLGLASAVAAACGLTGALLAKGGRDVPVAARVRTVTAAMTALAATTVLLPGPLTLAVCMAGVALLTPLVTVPVNTLLYARVPDELMGRVQSSLFLVGASMYPFAALTAGFLTEHTRLAATTGVFAALLAAALALTATPVFRTGTRTLVN
ncbi:MFS transporter [Streptomyces sp. CRN 30]|uniref:MFS transporter n=1 Tax=Streptomyces sp. CRN 30 TaxID=3075613 RepID=UPI002A800876|nr:MFS transporter [Streptomyces sp. CRN 30]